MSMHLPYIYIETFKQQRVRKEELKYLIWTGYMHNDPGEGKTW